MIKFIIIGCSSLKVFGNPEQDKLICFFFVDPNISDLFIQCSNYQKQNP